MSFASLLMFAGLFALPWTLAGLIHPPAAGVRNFSRWKVLAYGSAAFVILLGVASSLMQPKPETPATATSGEVVLGVLWFLTLFVGPVAALVARHRPPQPAARGSLELTAVEQKAVEQHARRAQQATSRNQEAAPSPPEPRKPAAAPVADPFDRLHPETVPQRTVSFMYMDSKGDASRREVDVSEVGTSHFSGFCHKRSETRTFRFDRIVGSVTLSDNGETLPPQQLRDVLRGYDETALRQQKRLAAKTSLEILFTGFPKGQRAELEALAASAGMAVRKTVTGNLDLLCAGANAGPTKVAAAEERGVMVLNEAQFMLMLETGEVPA